MEKSWNYVFEFLWELWLEYCIIDMYIMILITVVPVLGTV